jgi:transposase-like protein
MTSTSSLPTCPNPACEQPHVIRNGSSKGRRRYQCRGCGRFFGETEGTPMYRLHTPVAEVAQALLVVMRRGSLRAAEEITGHKYETIGESERACGGLDRLYWLRAPCHARRDRRRSRLGLEEGSRNTGSPDSERKREQQHAEKASKKRKRCSFR